jgi:uncharacterized protein YdcH (DUF465 family)
MAKKIFISKIIIEFLYNSTNNTFMNSSSNLKKLFEEWNDLNTSVQDSFGQFDFSKIKEIRKKQKALEDKIYENLLENATDDIKEILPNDCGEMEVGYDIEGKTFYFVMFDPEYEDVEETKLIAVTLDINNKVSLIKDFKME